MISAPESVPSSESASSPESLSADQVASHASSSMVALESQLAMTPTVSDVPEVSDAVSSASDELADLSLQSKTDSLNLYTSSVDAPSTAPSVPLSDSSSSSSVIIDNSVFDDDEEVEDLADEPLEEDSSLLIDDGDLENAEAPQRYTYNRWFLLQFQTRPENKIAPEKWNRAKQIPPIPPDDVIRSYQATVTASSFLPSLHLGKRSPASSPTNNASFSRSQSHSSRGRRDKAGQPPRSNAGPAAMMSQSQMQAFFAFSWYQHESYELSSSRYRCNAICHASHATTNASTSIWTCRGYQLAFSQKS